MPTPPLSDQEKARRKAAIERRLKEGFNPPGVTGGPRLSAIDKAADDLGIPRNTVRSSVRRGDVVVDWSVYERPVDAPDRNRTAMEIGDGQPDEPLESRERQRLTDQIADLKAELREAHRTINASEGLREAVFGLAREPVIPPDYTLEIEQHGRGQLLPMLLVTDVHAGEVVDLEEMEGLNEYNLDIFRRRFRTMIQHSIDMCRHHISGTDYPGFVLLVGGDLISGDIHEELTRTNDVPSHPALKAVVQEMVKALEVLADEFGRVVSIWVPGNHGRTTRKPTAKLYAELNYDFLAAWMCERYFQARGDDRVLFRYPRSGDALFWAFDTRCLLTHGDRIGSRGGEGFVGPGATILRGFAKTRKQYIDTGISVDAMFIGHFHTSMQYRRRLISNGSIVGFNEYARAMLRAEFEPPMQSLITVSPKWGVTNAYSVFLEDQGAPGGPTLDWGDVVRFDDAS